MYRRTGLGWVIITKDISNIEKSETHTKTFSGKMYKKFFHYKISCLHCKLCVTSRHTFWNTKENMNKITYVPSMTLMADPSLRPSIALSSEKLSIVAPSSCKEKQVR